MKTVYKIKGYIAFSELDNFKNGCQPNGKTEFIEGFEAQAPTLRGLLDYLKSEFCVDSDESFLLDSCEEAGRLDLQVTQIKPFEVSKLQQKTVDDWKAGKRDLWLTCYSFQVEKVESEFSLAEALEAEKA